MIAKLLGFRVTRKMAEEVPDEPGGGFEIPMSIVVDDHQADHGFLILVQLAELDGNVLAFAGMNLLPVPKREAEGRIHAEIQVARHGHVVDRLINTPDIEIGTALPIVLIEETDRIIMRAYNGTITDFHVPPFEQCMFSHVFSA